MEWQDSLIEFISLRLLGPVKRLMFWRPRETQGGKIRWVPASERAVEAKRKEGWAVVWQV